MAEPVRARRLADQEGQRLQQIVRRGKHQSVRVRRAMIIMASASGGRLRLISDGDIEVIVTAARTRPEKPVRTFTRWSLRWRNARARHPGVLAAQRRERARIRSERQQRRGRPKPETA